MQTDTGAAGVLIGGMLTERLALLYEGGIVSYSDATAAYSHLIGDPAVQYFVNEARVAAKWTSSS